MPGRTPPGTALPYASVAGFRALHALRVKGFATVEALAPVAALPPDELADHLASFQARELALYREARGLWQLTPAGRDAHEAALAEDVGRPHVGEGLHGPYEAFLELNTAFKALCSDWQLRDGAPNDHADEAYDQAVVERLVAHDRATQPVVSVLGEVLLRMAPYAERLASACVDVAGGRAERFTGVMCASYHDIWMELHEDLIVSQGIDRAREGSF
ncbi:MAG: MarR family transcriptional regulator [Acidimicrobiia bacterium]|nr:MarR family transcriptional regulator [Acidimicrobiia bacterium]